MGVPALGAGTSCDFKIESSGPEIVGEFALWTILPTRFKAKGISRYNSWVTNSHGFLKLFCQLTFCIEILRTDMFGEKWTLISGMLYKLILGECSTQDQLFNSL